MQATRTIDVLVIEPGEWRARRETIDPQLRDFQRLVGGYIEALDLGETVSAYINEEGKLNDLPRNEAADKLVHLALRKAGRRLMLGDYIVGPLVLTGPPDDEGETQGVTQECALLLAEVGIPVVDGGDEPPPTVYLPDGPIESKVTGRDGRTVESRLDTALGERTKLSISTHHDKDRKAYYTYAQGIVVGDRFVRMMLSPGSMLRVRTEPTARFSAKGLMDAHIIGLALVDAELRENPDAFTSVLMHVAGQEAD